MWRDVTLAKWKHWAMKKKMLPLYIWNFYIHNFFMYILTHKIWNKIRSFIISSLNCYVTSQYCYVTSQYCYVTSQNVTWHNKFIINDNNNSIFAILIFISSLFIYWLTKYETKYVLTLFLSLNCYFMPQYCYVNVTKCDVT